MARIALTGATGLIGRRLLPILSGAGHEVHVLGRTSPKQPSVNFHCIDLLSDCDALPHLLREIEASHALHLAWYAEPGRFWSASENYEWLAASLRFARGFAAAGGSRLVVAGSCAEYDWTGDGRLDEAATPLKPVTLYGEAKRDLLVLLSGEATSLGLSLGWARIFFPFAADERPARLLGTLIAAARGGGVAQFSAGTQVRDFIAASDVALALEALLLSKVEGAVNIGSGRALSVREFVERAAKLADADIPLSFSKAPIAAEQPPLLVAVTRRLRQEVGFRHEMDIDASLLAVLEEAGLRRAECAFEAS